MTDWVTWFRYQLQASADAFIWAFSRIPPAFREEVPPDTTSMEGWPPAYLGTWPPARHVWHITEYERHLAIPAMRLWLDDKKPSGEAWPDDDGAWNAVQDRGLDALADAFRQVRQQQIDLLDQLSGTDWLTPRQTGWGPQPLSMVVTKTFQHTYEHGDTLLRMGLWWAEILAEKAG
jgi:hypothetical protein